MNPIRGKLSDHAAKGYSQIDAYEHDLQHIYLRARNRIEMELSSFLQRRNASFTGPRLIGLFDDLNEMFPQFEEEYRETYEHALNYMAHQNYAAALQDMGLRENVVGSMDKSLFNNMLQDGFQHIAGATKQMQTEVISELRRMSARVMREATLTGMTRAEVSRHLAAELLYAPDAKLRDFQFIDAGGRHWKTEKYFNMLGRTLLHNNARECYLAGCAKAGSDIVTVSVSGDCCDACGRYENELLSITGATPGLPTLQEAMDDGLFHPNCTHRIIAVPETIARKYYGMGEGGKSSGQSPKISQVSQTGPTGQTKPVKPQETHEQHLARRQQQWNDAYDKRRDQWYQSIINAGGSKEIAAELADLYTPEMAKLGKPPKVTFDPNDSSHVTADNKTLNLQSNSLTKWNSCKGTLRHEFTHWAHQQLRKKDPDFEKQIEIAAQKDWITLQGQYKNNMQQLKNGSLTDVFSTLMYGKQYSILDIDQRYVITGMADTIGSISHGKYGFGHPDYSGKAGKYCQMLYGTKNYYAIQNNHNLLRNCPYSLPYGEAVANISAASEFMDKNKLKLVFPELYATLEKKGLIK